MLRIAIVLFLAFAQPPKHPVPAPTPRPAPVQVKKTTPSNWVAVQEERYKVAQIRPEKLHYVQAIAAATMRGKPRYEAVQRRTGVPWRVIAVIHNMECSLNWNQNLANGDSIHYKTRHVPKGRPPGQPPFSWEECAVDALKYDSLDRKNWNGVGVTLQNIELYNGPGYQKFHPDVPTPYLWSWSTVYLRGKYIADGQWSSTAISQQCGCVPILKLLQ